MTIVVFGLTISSSWGNGHATLWRGLCRALAENGHRVVFFERDVPYYADTRDYIEIPGGQLVLYPDWGSIAATARRELANAEVAIVTSYCPDALAASRLIVDDGGALAVFYDLDSPVTLSKLRHGQKVDYIGPCGLSEFDLVLSFVGGAALNELKQQLGARHVAPLYGHVDPAMHRRVDPVGRYRADLSYLGTFSDDRQPALESLLLAPARECPDRAFLIAGAQYPRDFPWADNIFFVRHLAPGEHPAFYSSSRITLNLTRRAMAEIGWCPSGRLFEAAACGVPVLTDRWDGLDSFFAPGREVLIADTSEDAIRAIDIDDAELRAIGDAARERVLAEHTSARRADELVGLIDAYSSRAPLRAAAAGG